MMHIAARDSARLLQTDDDRPEPVDIQGAPPPAGDTAGDGVLMRLRRRKLLFVTAFCLVLLAVAGAFFYLPTAYRADAVVTVAPSERVVAAQGAADGQQATVGDSADLESQSVILASPLLLRGLLQQPGIHAALLQECEAARPPPWKQAVKDALHMQPPRPCAELVADDTSMVANLRGRVVVGYSGRSRILTLQVSSPLPGTAQTIANGIVQAYLNARTNEKQQPRDEAIEWLRAETTRVSARLRQNEAKIADSLHASGVIRGQLAPIASEQLTGLAQQVALAEAERATAAGRMQQARQSGGANSGVLESRAVGDVKQQLAGVTSQIAQLSARYGSAYPALSELQQQRRGLERLLGQETAVVNRSAAADYDAANSRVTALRQQLDSLKQEVRGNDNATTDVASLQRNLVTDRELFVDLSKSMNQLETDRRLVTPNARLVSLAELPQSPYFPKASTFGLTGLLLATAFATVVALLRDRADRTVRAVTSIQSAADLRVLARIPHVSRIGRGSSKLVHKMRHASAFQESIRGLYAECLLVSTRRGGRDKQLRSVMVTSSARGEGKSFTALALAHFAAAAGRRVLVLECDLRQPDMARGLGLVARPGVSEVLRGDITPEDAVRGSSSPSLDVILAGAVAMDSAELLGGPRMTELLAWAAARYDLVVVDTPPSRVVPDARILASAMDGVLYCAQWGQSPTSSVVTGVRDIRSAGGRVLGLVLDRVQQTHYHLYDSIGASPDSYLAVQRS